MKVLRLVGVLGEDLETGTRSDPTLPGGAWGEAKSSPKSVKGSDK